MNIKDGLLSVSEWQMTSPVVLIIFNRPDKARRVFLEIAKVKPPILLIISDGPRLSEPKDVELVIQSREIVNLVDWPCEILTNFSEVNLGCRVRLSSGLDWVFQHVDRAIILEDDCLPSNSFFRFCDEALSLYEHDDRIGMINGSSFSPDSAANMASYYFSKFVHVWGWATWRHKWESYDVDMKLLPSVIASGDFSNICGGDRSARYFEPLFQAVRHKSIDTWDYQWWFSNLCAGRVNVTPFKNLVENFGFDSSATHTKQKIRLSNRPALDISFPLKHPSAVVRNIAMDSYVESRHFSNSVPRKFFKKLKNLFLLFAIK
jgi:hypothetical protein